MKYFYQLLLLLSCLPAGAQSLYEKYERFLTTPARMFAIVRMAN